MSALKNNIEDYLRRSGDEYLDSEGIFEENEHGFCVWSIYEDKLVLKHVYGNGTYWNDWADNKAKELGLSNIFFATKRNPQGFMKKFDYNLIGYVLERKAKWAV